MQPNKSIIANETSSACTPASELAVSPNSNDPYAGDVPYELAVSPKSNDPSAGDVTAVSASNINDTSPEPIEGKPPDQAWLAEHKFDGVDFTLPSPDSSEGPFHLRRRLQGKITTWACHRPDLNRFAGSVNIWWGHTQGNEAWACNSWQAACKNSCTAKEVTQSHWNCYRQSDLKFVGQASISWGHGVGDGVYACNNWVSDCRTSQGGCLVTGAPHWNDGKPWDCHPLKSTWGDGCSVPDWLDVFPNAKEGLRLACDQHDYCYYGPIKNGFWDTYRHCTKLFFSEILTKHWDPNDPMYKAGNTWKDVMTLDPLWQTGAPVFLPGFGDGFQNQQLASDAECYLGKSKPQGYQRAPCQSEGVCLPGTSCYNCCAGDSGWACKKPWWE